MGSKAFLQPVLLADINEIPKKVMESLFHYMSVIMVLTTIILLSISFGEYLWFESNDVVKVIGISYLGFAIVQLVIAAKSSIVGGAFKMFQWIFWIMIGLFSLLGIFV